MKLKNILKSLLTEIADREELKNCIKKRKVCIIYYEGDDPYGKGQRTIEPVCLGVSLAGNTVLRAWDIEGASQSSALGEQPLPGWRMFDVNKISSLQPTSEIFTQMRPGYNPNGDKSMVSVIINSKF